jgi:hypothetical protein
MVKQEEINVEDDQALVDLLDAEDRLKQQGAEVAEAIEERLNKGFGVGGKEWTNVYEHQIDDGDFKEQLFWEEEIRERLKEHADEILTRRLILEEKKRIQASSASSAASQADSAYVNELTKLEDAFEEATHQRMEEMDQQMASKLQKQFGEGADGGLDLCIQGKSAGVRITAEAQQTKLGLIRRLITRIQNK